LGWTTSSGRDGRAVAHPLGWTTSTGKDGRAFGHALGASTDEGKDGRLLAVPGVGANELLFIHAHLLELVSQLKADSEAAEATNALLYWFVNDQDE